MGLGSYFEIRENSRNQSYVVICPFFLIEKKALTTHGFPEEFFVENRRIYRLSAVCSTHRHERRSIMHSLQIKIGHMVIVDYGHGKIFRGTDGRMTFDNASWLVFTIK